MRLNKQHASEASMTWVFSIYRALSLWTDTTPIPHMEILLLASTRTTIHSALNCLVLRHTSLHTYDIPEEANTGWGCGWCVWGTWLDTSVKQSSKLLAGVPTAPLSALRHFTYSHTKHRRLALVPFVRQPFVYQASVIGATGVCWTLVARTKHAFNTTWCLNTWACIHACTIMPWDILFQLGSDDRTSILQHRCILSYTQTYTTSLLQ